MYKLLVVDDEPLVRRGIVTLIDHEKLGITEIYEAASGQEAYELFITHGPHMILLDINIPKVNGLELAKRIKHEAPQTKIAMLTGYDYFDYAQAAIKIGVEDYVLKPFSREDITLLLIKLTRLIESERAALEIKDMVKNMLSTEHLEDDATKNALIKFTAHSLGDASFSLTKLADQMGFSASYTSTLFKTLMGQSFQDYMLNTRLEKSKLLLLTTDLKVYEVADRVGFDDVNYFSVRFKKKYGISPKNYTANVRTSDE